MFSSHIYLKVIFLPGRRGLKSSSHFLSTRDYRLDEEHEIHANHKNKEKTSCRAVGGKSFSHYRSQGLCIFKKSELQVVASGARHSLTLTLSALSKPTRVDQCRTRRAWYTEKKISRTCAMKGKEVIRWTRKKKPIKHSSLAV